MKSTDILWSRRRGEILYHGVGRDLHRKYAPDTPFDRAIVPYFVMLFCAAVDGAVFYSLFSSISYDRPLMLGVQIAGFLFGFDIVPIYIGIQLRRVRQGLSGDKFILWLALSACAVVCAMNTGLRLSTMDQLTPNVTHTSLLGTPQQTAPEIDSAAISLTIFGIGIPVVTSVGSFFISYLTYDPLKARKQVLEALIAEKRDECRRFEAILCDYDAETDFAEHMEQEDAGKYAEMLRLQRALVLGYCDYSRQRLKEHLGDPTSTNILSQEVCGQLSARLDRELACLESGATPPQITKIVPVNRDSAIRKVMS